jgi:D(-)-tartrate dehydratase
VMKNEKPGGHGDRCGAVGLIDAALWDLAAKRAEMPLWHHLMDQDQMGDGAMPGADVYASGGDYHPENDIAALCDDVRRAIVQGHRRFKIKIGGAELKADLKRIEAVLAIIEPEMSLAVDGGAAFDLQTAVRYVTALAGYPLLWLEEPVSPLDFESHRELAERSSVPLATGENLFSADDARNLLRYAGLRSDRDVLQFDISLSYGIVEYRRILDELSKYGWSRSRCAPHAGQLLALHAVVGFGLGLAEIPMDTSTLFGKLTSHVLINDGTARLPDAPGAGFEAASVFSEIFGGLLN